MSLTGPVFLVLVIVITVAAFVAVVVLWPRLAGPSPARIAARAGLLLGVNLLVLLTAATQLNAQFLFFADWSDLSGALGGTTATTSLSRGSSAAAAATKQLPNGQNAAASGPAGGVGRARPSGPIGADGVVSTVVTGRLSGITARVVVRLPSGYLDPANASVRYPVLVAFPGYPGDAREWLGIMNLGGVLDEAVQHRGLRAPIVVVPQIEIPRGADTECVNGSPGRPQVETWVAQDVPDWIARTFRVDLARSSWATIGLSAGGWCAAMALLLHPAQFSAAIVMGGYFRPDFGPAYEPYPPLSPLEQRYDLVKLVQRSPPPVALWLETSHADALSYSSSAALLKAARPPMAVDAVVLQNAGHRFGIWQGLLPQAVAWLGKNIPGFRPVP